MIIVTICWSRMFRQTDRRRLKDSKREASWGWGQMRELRFPREFFHTFGKYVERYCCGWGLDLPKWFFFFFGILRLYLSGEMLYGFIEFIFLYFEVTLLLGNVPPYQILSSSTPNLVVLVLHFLGKTHPAPSPFSSCFCWESLPLPSHLDGWSGPEMQVLGPPRCPTPGPSPHVW